jgi:hypothetical protein
MPNAALSALRDLMAQRPQIVPRRTNGHWSVLVHTVTNVVQVFADLTAEIAMAVIRIFQMKGGSVVELAGEDYLDLMLTADL